MGRGARRCTRPRVRPPTSRKESNPATQNYVLRAARETDVDGILACLSAAFAPFRSQYTARAYAATVLTEKAASLRLRRMTVLVADHPRRGIVGTVSVKWLPDEHAHLRGMAVLPAWQGRGVASALLRRALRIIQKRDRRHVTLETTEPLQRAMEFYRRHGFYETLRRRSWGGMRLIEFELHLPVRRIDRKRPISSAGTVAPAPR
jgi:ribosomal protein S18 acetylase RimI-like enzyme